MRENENFVHKFLRNEKVVAIFMLCWQIVYLHNNIGVFYIYTVLMELSTNLGFVGTIGRIISFGFIDTLFLIIVVAYPFVSIFSFCVFVWAYKTKNLLNSKVFYMYSLPLFSLIAKGILAPLLTQ